MMRLFEDFLLILQKLSQCLYFRRKVYNSPRKTTNAQQKIFTSNLNALQNKARPDPTNYSDINDNESNNSDGDCCIPPSIIPYRLL